MAKTKTPPVILPGELIGAESRKNLVAIKEATGLSFQKIIIYAMEEGFKSKTFKTRCDAN